MPLTDMYVALHRCVAQLSLHTLLKEHYFKERKELEDAQGREARQDAMKAAEEAVQEAEKVTKEAWTAAQRSTRRIPLQMDMGT